MIKYMATVRANKGDQPCKITFGAANIAFALTEMVKLSGKKSLDDLHQYVLYEVEEKDNVISYTEKAVKDDDEKAPIVVKALPPPKADPAVVEENKYAPAEEMWERYTVKEV